MKEKLDMFWIAIPLLGKHNKQFEHGSILIIVTIRGEKDTYFHIQKTCGASQKPKGRQISKTISYGAMRT